jgi:hypothetical protein
MPLCLCLSSDLLGLQEGRPRDGSLPIEPLIRPTPPLRYGAQVPWRPHHQQHSRCKSLERAKEACHRKPRSGRVDASPLDRRLLYQRAADPAHHLHTSAASPATRQHRQMIVTRASFETQGLADAGRMGRERSGRGGGRITGSAGRKRERGQRCGGHRRETAPSRGAEG